MMTAVYPGSFDPTTLGHLDIIDRASSVMDKLIVAVLNNPSKRLSCFTVEERIKHLTYLTGSIKNVCVTSFQGLLVDFMKQNDSRLIIRGLRAVTDFEYEFQMALTNRNLCADIETLFISTSTQYLYLSSSVVKEVFNYGGNLDGMVPPYIKERLEEKRDKCVIGQEGRDMKWRD